LEVKGALALTTAAPKHQTRGAKEKEKNDVPGTYLPTFFEIF
jgi:hypothetical protein